MDIEDIFELEKDNVKVEYYKMNKNHTDLKLAPRNLITICNTLYNYAKIQSLRQIINQDSKRAYCPFSFCKNIHTI